MGSSQEPPLDEIQWRSPPIAQSMGGIQTNTVLPYFYESPFFDQTSNNAIITTQATYNPNLFYLIQTREAFEGRLKTMQGLEYMVAHDPSDNGHTIENSGVWVIRKQNRRKRQGSDDDLVAISSYFVVGENIYMAPSVGNVLGSRLLSTVTSLTQLFSIASGLPKFTPSTGHTYFPPASKGLTSAAQTQVTQPSKENTPMPGTQDSTKPPLITKSTSDSEYQGLQLLAESYNLSSRYGKEYMDENPLVGEPGSFILSKSREAGPAVAHPQTKAPAPPKLATSPDVKPTVMPLPGKKSAKGAEKSPVSPGTKEKKQRRKSKAAGSTTTPK
ncbi:Mediator of RNA polymerase II transcription subunit 6 [Lobaria immixta]|nr:Mediator of RNA polymerase II transcription subunit 6 [Lobaria immixta]